MGYDDLTNFIEFSYRLIINNIEISLIVPMVVIILFLLFSNKESEVNNKIDNRIFVAKKPQLNKSFETLQRKKQVESKKKRTPKKNHNITKEDLQNIANNIIKRYGRKAISEKEALQWLIKSNNSSKISFLEYIGYLSDVSFSEQPLIVWKIISYMISLLYSDNKSILHKYNIKCIYHMTHINNL